MVYVYISGLLLGFVTIDLILFTNCLLSILVRHCYFRGFWRRHRRKLYVTAGVLGSGYLLYKLYNAHRQRLADLDTELEHERDRNEELIKAQLREIPTSISVSRYFVVKSLTTYYLGSNIMSFCSQ